MGNKYRRSVGVIQKKDKVTNKVESKETSKEKRTVGESYPP